MFIIGLLKSMFLIKLPKTDIKIAINNIFLLEKLNFLKIANKIKANAAKAKISFTNIIKPP